MPRKNDYGKYILAAGEIGTYTVCPESWRLSIVEKVKLEEGQASARGSKLHKEWATLYEDATYFARSARLLVIVMLALIFFSILKHLIEKGG